MPPNNACEQCKAVGLPILPVRYAVAPKIAYPELPGWVSGKRVTSVALGDEFHYTLRTLRSGYLYLFYDKNARGSKQWECYAVGADGSLIKQPDAKSARPQPTPVLQCSRHGSNNTQVHYLVIEHPERCGTTWIAYTEYKWSDETIAAYEKDPKLRNKRMQTIQPPVMATGAKHSHGQIADKASLEAIAEYAPSSQRAPAPFNFIPATSSRDIGNLSKEDGSYDAAKLEVMSTRHGSYGRFGIAEYTAQHMTNRGKSPSGDSKPHVLALWDAIGVGHELNGFRNDAAGWIKKYGDERALQMDALNTYDGLKNVVEANAQKQAETAIMRGVEDNELLDYQRELEQKLKNSPDDEYLQHQLAWIRDTNERIKAGAPKVAKAFGESQARQAWPKYRDHIDVGSLDRFKAALAKFQSNAAQIIDRRTPSLVHWLEAPLFLDTLNDFHGQNIEDGLLFEEVVAEAMFGIGSCPSGALKVQEWIEQCKATMESNLLWRVVALNQDDARAELDTALAEAKQHKGAQTLATSLVWINYTNKSLKAFADTYKKAQGVFDGNTRAASETGSVAFGARLRHFNMRGTDKFAISVGDAVFRAFRIDKLADYASEKIIQHIFSIRGFVNPADSINLIVKQAQSEGLLREQTLQRLRTARVFLAADTPAIRNAQAEALRGEWRKFKAGGSDASASAIKDARLALVVGLIEGMNFAKLLADCRQKNDMKSWLSLVASGMAITSAMFDVGAVVAKNLPSMGNASWGYQSLKLWGGVLSSGASFIGGGLDLRDAGKQRSDGYFLLAFLYDAKGAAALTSGALTLAVTFTYSAPLVARLTGDAALGIAVRAVGARAAAFIGLRVLGMALGGWITVGAITIQVVIWWVTPDALEKWIDHSAFGKNRETGGYRTPEAQVKALQEALAAMGFQ